MRPVGEHQRVVAGLIAPRSPVRVPIAEALGLVLADDVRTADGVVLLRKGRRLTWAIIEKFHCHREAIRNLHPIEVIVRKKAKHEAATASS